MPYDRTTLIHTRLEPDEEYLRLSSTRPTRDRFCMGGQGFDKFQLIIVE